ncbi:MAG: hypothetical protein OXH52_06145 [Gammaproteobacteria bacterium]|nr:hypothetical protein [Gammaproteobacteria bacterium]
MLEWRDELSSLGFEDQVTSAVTATDPPIALTHVAPVHALAISTGCAPGRRGAGTSAWT